MLIDAKSLKDWLPGKTPRALEGARRVLIFGNDEGGIQALARSMVGDDGVQLQADSANASQINSLLNTQSLFGGASNVLLRGIKDANLGMLDSLWVGDGLMVATAGDVKKTTRLVKAFDTHGDAIQVYTLESKDAVAWLTQALSNTGLTLDKEAATAMYNLLPGDRMELERLAEVLALSALGRKAKNVALNDVRDILPDLRDLDMSGALDAALMGNQTDCLVQLDKQLSSGETVIGLLRLWAWKLQRLSDMEGPIAAAIAKAKPPVFWKDKSLYEHALKKLTAKGAMETLLDLDGLEQRIVHHGAPPRIACEHFLLKLATRCK